MLEMVEELWDMMFVMEKSKIIGSYRKDEVGDKDLDALFFEMTGGENRESAIVSDKRSMINNLKKQ